MTHQFRWVAFAAGELKKCPSVSAVEKSERFTQDIDGTYESDPAEYKKHIIGVKTFWNGVHFQHSH